MNLVSRAYGYTSLDEEEEDGRSEMNVDKVPFKVLELLSFRPTRSLRKCIIDGVKYTIFATSEADSSICFTIPPSLVWVAGRIEYILEGPGAAVKLVVRRCKTCEGRVSDPFIAFWSEGFQAKLVSTSFEDELQAIDAQELTGHTARWELTSDEVAVLKRSKVCGG